jgi:hypothetical protein
MPTQKEIIAHLNVTIKQMIAFAAKRFDLDEAKLANGKYSVKWKVTGALAKGGTIATGVDQGRPTMTFYLGDFPKVELLGYTEYASFNGSPTIGGFHTKDWRLFLDALVAHEISHVVQFMLPKSTSKLRRGSTLDFAGLTPYGVVRFERSHGDFFKSIYREFRKEFINHRVTESRIGNPPKWWFDRDKHEATVAVSSKHPLIGRSFVYNGKTYKVVDIQPRRWKFPLTVVDAANKRWKMTMKSAIDGLI